MLFILKDLKLDYIFSIVLRSNTNSPSFSTLIPCIANMKKAKSLICINLSSSLKKSHITVNKSKTSYGINFLVNIFSKNCFFLKLTLENFF